MPGSVLIADDNDALRGVLAQVLHRNGFEVISAANGKEALELSQSRRPDVVLLDVMMPGLTGFEVCRRIKSNAQSRLTPVVLVTGLADTEHRIRGLEAGADDLLAKPVEQRELLARVHSMFRMKSYLDELERSETVILAMARSIEGKDPYTKGHCERLAELSACLGEQMGLPPEEITALRRAGIVHDIGKVAVPDAVLLKPDRLTEEEKAIMHRHPIVGEEICAPLKCFRLVLPIVRHHHEKFDGSGYPDGLRGEEIPLTARILQVVDVYDALTTERPYKAALTPDAALEIMEEEVQIGWWDPRVFAEFKKMLAGLPPNQSQALAGLVV